MTEYEPLYSTVEFYRGISLGYWMSNHPRTVKKASHVALIFKRSKLIEFGFNRMAFRTEDKFTTHAEENAINKAGRRANGSTMYVFRFLKNKQIAMAMPCKKCKVQIERAGIRKVYYSV